MSENTERRFTWLTSDSVLEVPDEKVETFGHELLAFLKSQIIGDDEEFETPFGPRRMTYCDWIASGRSLRCVEKYISDEVLTMYANTHSTSSRTGVQSSLFRAEARNIILHACNGSKDDVVLFAGTGSTGCINKLVSILNIKNRVLKGEKVVVLIGPWEHHSNILPWKEAGAEVKTINLNELILNPQTLEKACREFKNYDLKIGTFCAGSNVTGLLEDTITITEILHKYGFLAFWDCACVGPYLDLDMNPGNILSCSKDAIFLSPHKFLGGPSTPGVLVIKKSLLTNATPSVPGGGTVFYVSETSNYAYLDNFEEREEGGTQDIVGAVRAGLAFQIKSKIGPDLIQEVEHAHMQSAFKIWKKNPNIHLLGGFVENRVSVFSFMISHQLPGETKMLYLHYNFIASLLNDLFGIQGRGGCMCAGPYAINLLGLQDIWPQVEDILLSKNELFRPGFMRISLHYTLTESEVDFISRAVDFVANEGWKFLPQYGYYEDTGEWRHRKNFKRILDRRSLGHINYKGGKMNYTTQHRNSEADKNFYLTECWDILEDSIKEYPFDMVDEKQFFTPAVKALKWFVLPSEALNHLKLLKNSTMSSKKIQQTNFNKNSGGVIDQIPMSTHEDRIIKERNNFSQFTNESMFNMTTMCLALGSLSVASVVLHQKKINLNPLWLLPLAISSFMIGSTQVREKKVEKSQIQLINFEENIIDNDNKDLEHTEFPCKNCFHRHITTSAECIYCNCVEYIPLKSKENVKKKLSKKERKKLEQKLRRPIGKAIKDYDMIKDGDRVLVGLSGGKDSLTMLHILLIFQKIAPIQFDIGACTIDPEHPEYDPSPLIEHLKQIGVPYFYESEDIMRLAKEKMKKNGSFCSFCSRMKRGKLYGVCRRENYNVLAMGQHCDDLCESFLMSAIFNGKLRTMKANYHVKDGDIRVIRPLIYVRERLTREYADKMDLPIINENCPACFDSPQERQRMKQLLASQEHLHGPVIFSNLMATMEPLIKKNNDYYNPKEKEEDLF